MTPDEKTWRRALSPEKALTPHTLGRIHARIRQWYADHGRHHLPWRTSADPYAIYVSEVMLQQTQVSTVLERYYTPFLQKYPTLEALARAPLQDVLKAWEGLGYYSRARNLHNAAQLSGGSLPVTVEDLQALPGIGKNTAHAIVSLSRHGAVPVMEANVKRVIARIHALQQPAETLLWEKAWQLLDTKDAFTHNQAMMDVGALICTPRHPKCPGCPLLAVCKAARRNPENYPLKKIKPPLPMRICTIVVLQNSAKQYFLEARKEKLLHGLYGFPQIEPKGKTVVAGNKAYALKGYTYFGKVTHAYSHFKLSADVCFLPVKSSDRNGWHDLEDIKTLPLSRVDIQVLKLLERHRSLQNEPNH